MSRIYLTDPSQHVHTASSPRDGRRGQGRDDGAHGVLGDQAAGEPRERVDRGRPAAGPLAREEHVAVGEPAPESAALDDREHGDRQVVRPDQGERRVIDPVRRRDELEHGRRELLGDEPLLGPRPPLEQLQETYMARLHDPVVFISAQQKENIEALRELLGRKVAELYQIRYPYSINNYQ